MPELPEVEIIKRGLEKRIIGLTIKDLVVIYKKSVQFDPKNVIGHNILNVWRRAKMLGVDLTGGQSIVFHLKMTGQLIYVDGKNRLIGGHPTPDMRDQMPNQSTVVILEFSDGSKLYFNDQRRFGWVKLFKTKEVEADDYKILGELGPEPFDPIFSWQLLKTNLAKHPKMPIKVALMDQSLVAGIGNIYASESLFLAKIDPRRKVSTLSDEDFQKLYTGIKKALETAIKRGGSTRAHFVNIEGEKGYFLDYANVYSKEGQPCKGCKGKVVKITQAGRGTYLCPSCQK